MSTIFTCLNFNDPVAESTLTNMISASDYWQPDATSLAANHDGHCRMARAALFNTAQSKLETVRRDDAGNLISANARLDNRSELAEALGIAADRLAAMADGELILVAYGKWGEDCPKHLLGDFAFTIWDEANQRLFSARDHFGVKVLFYTNTRLGWMVSNEHNAFFTSGALEKRIDEAWLVQQLWNIAPSSYRSPCPDIEVLPPAHSLIIEDDRVRLSRYWDLEDKSDWKGMDDESLIEALGTRFRHAVHVRLESDFPLAAELSEGIDSNGITGVAARALGEQPLYTLSYGCIELDDENRQVWEATYRDIFEMHAMHANIRTIWQKQAENNEQARLDTQAYYRSLGVPMPVRDGAHLDYSRHAAARGARVILSGWGGDHCVSTYGDYYESELLTQGKLTALHRLLVNKKLRNRSGHPLKAWARLLLKHGLPPVYRRLLRKRGGVERSQHELARIHPLRSEYLERYGLLRKLKRHIDHYERYSVKAHHRRELFEIGVEKRLVESELCARMHRIEYRYPMLDVPLVELAYNMPSHLKIRDGIERYMYRHVLEGVTTPRIQWRVKADVAHPQAHARPSGHESNHAAADDAIADRLLHSTLLQRYFESEKLKVMSSNEARIRKLRRFEFLLDIEQMIADGEACIVQTD